SVCCSLLRSMFIFCFFFFFNATATTDIYTLSLHDALPIFNAVLDAVKGAGIEPISSDITMRPTNSVQVTGGTAQQVLRLMEALRSEEHTSELQSQSNLVCRLLLEKKKTNKQKERNK